MGRNPKCPRWPETSLQPKSLNNKHPCNSGNDLRVRETVTAQYWSTEDQAADAITIQIRLIMDVEHNKPEDEFFEDLVRKLPTDSKSSR